MARRQHGIVSRQQLLLFGFTSDAIQRRVDSGHLHRVHRGVYAVGHPSLTWRGYVSAAVLACGLDSVGSHLSAAAIQGFTAQSNRMHVTSPSRHRVSGVITHRATLGPADRTIIDGIPLTSTSRTLLDLAVLLPRVQFTRAYEEADRLRLVDEEGARELLDRCTGHRGAASLAALLDETFAHPPTRLELERIFYELVADAGLPPPLVNVWVEGHRVDAYWPRYRLVVELDSKTYHRTDAKIERDYDTSAELKLAGYEVIRFTWKQVTRKRELAVALLGEAIGRAG